MELAPAMCGSDGETIAFTETIIVELDICETPLQTADDFVLLEELLVSTYNQLVSTSYCDPYFRSLDTASVVQQGSLTADGHLPVEIAVAGTCRGGCDSETIRIYDIPGSEPTNSTTPSRRQRLTRQLDEEDASINTDSTCYCSSKAVADRAPSEAEFLNAYRNQTLLKNESLSCVESIVECQFGTKFESALLISLEWNISSIETFEDYQETLESVVLLALNQVYDTSSQDDDICFPEFRLFQSIEAARFGLNTISDTKTTRQLEDTVATVDSNTTANVTSNSTTEMPSASPTPGVVPPRISIVLYTTGVCNGCASNAAFANQLTNRARARMLAENDAPRFLQDEEEAISYCYCALNSTIVDLQPSLEEFQVALQGQLLEDGIQVQGVEELDSTSCSNDVVPFTKTVIVELASILCDDQKTLDDDLPLLEKAFVSAYNGLSLEYCDPFLRTLETAKIIKQGDVQTTIDGNTPVEVQVTGTCRGCDPNTISIYDFPTGPSTSGSNSRLLFPDASAYNQQERALETDPSCYCKTNAIANRAPSETEFMKSYEILVSSTEGLSCVGSVGQCDFGSFFQIPLVFQFSNGTAVDDYKEQIENSTLSSLTQLYESTDETCFSDFPVFLGVQLGAATRRQLQVDQSNFPTEFPSSSPTNASTAIIEPSITVVLFTTGFCNGCSNDFLFGNQVVNGRRKLEKPSPLPRFLEEDKAESNCFCPLGSTIAQEDPTTDDLQQIVQSQLVEAGAPLELLSVKEGDPEAFQEPFLCESNTVEFTETVVVDLKVSCEDAPTLDETEKKALADEFVSTYNSLNADYCDPYFRRLTDAAVSEVGSLRDGDSLPIKLSLSGECRGCNPQNVSVYDLPPATSVSTRRFLSSEQPVEQNSKSRHLNEVGDTCYCGSQYVAKRAPLESEFIKEYQPAVGNLTIDCIGGIGQCDFPSSFETAILLSFENDPNFVFEEYTTIIADVFKRTVNEQLQTDSQTCNQLSQIITQVSSNLDFLVNG